MCQSPSIQSIQSLTQPSDQEYPKNQMNEVEILQIQL